jgi:hypothetical protein
MWTIIDGFDHTDIIPFDTIGLSSSLNDPQPSAKFDVVDIESQLSFAVGMEVIVFDENAPPTFLLGGGVLPTIPAHNLLQKAVYVYDTVAWSTAGALSITKTSANQIQLSFSNNPIGQGLLQQTTLPGYVHPGQSYMLSAYVTINQPLVNAASVMQMDFLDTAGNIISGASVSDLEALPLNNARIAIQAVAPANASMIRVSLGGQTMAATNSGIVQLATFQLEPMWFAGRGVSYPTPDCNFNQVACARMPDDTISRACRTFSGFIDDCQIDYANNGNTRTWHLSISGPGALLESAIVNAVYQGQYDDQIISSVIGNYAANQISLIQPNSSSPAPVQRGAVIDSVSYSDNTLREVLNGLVDTSGYMYYLDWYYTLRYNPSFYAAAPFMLTDGIADNISSFNFHDFTFESDGTQRKRRVKVIGAKLLATAQDVFSGNGTTKQFNLTYIPAQINSLVVGTTQQRVGINGRDSFSSGKFDVLLDKANQFILFNAAPPSATNNVAAIYSFEATITVQAVAQDANVPIAPAYAQPLYDARVHDTNIISLTSASVRGLAELSKYSKAQTIIKLSTNAYAGIGSIINVTHWLTSLDNAPFVVQQVESSYLGNGINEYKYTLGAYQPSLTDHIRNANKAMSRSATVARVNTVQQIDVVSSEYMSYSDIITATVQPVYADGVYGAAASKYGVASYGGMTGTYGTASYGTSYIYG